MASDRFSPVAPAYIRVLVLPVGRIERSRFTTCLQRLAEVACIVSLKDLLPHATSDDKLLAPRAFPNGCLLFNYTSSLPGEQQLQLSPFELFREPLLVLGIKDGCDGEDDAAQLKNAVEQLREKYPRVVHRQLIVLDGANAPSASGSDDLIHVDTSEEQYIESLWFAAMQFSVRFLAELSIYTRALQASPGIPTPGQTARSLQRSGSVKDQDKRPTSIYGASQAGSVPTSPIRATDESRARSPPLDYSLPATSFEQLASHNGQIPRPSRPESRASNQGKGSPRAPSQERASMQGFGSGTSHEKLKTRGKARVGIVVASIHMLAGQWGEALRLFIEHTSKARLLSDHIWHAKGLEGVVNCLLLNAWAGLDFQIPSICYPPTDRGVAVNMHRFSINIPSDFRLSLEGHPSPITKLATTLPELLTYILKLYTSGEGSLELPLLAVADITIRFSKLLAVLHNNGGTLDQPAFTEIVRGGSELLSEQGLTVPSAMPGSTYKATVIELLSTIYPLNEDTLSVADQAGILAGTASVYAMLQMYRKEAVIVKDMILKVTAALVQARKKGAAEMGIHPAAALTADVGINSMSSIAEDSDGLSKMMANVAATYGITVQDQPHSDMAADSSRYFGHDALKFEFMKALAAFCEAVPDPKGTLRINAAMLRSFGPNVAVDAEPAMKPPMLTKDEQIRCVTAIDRTIGLAKQLNLPTMEAEYWDDFIVRDIEFLPEDPGQAVINLTALRAGGLNEGTEAGNPLLYDPNSSRPSTAEDAPPATVLVQNETAICRITLQNPYDIPMEVESLELVTNGFDFQTERQRMTLKPQGIQRFTLSASPATTGKCKVTGCMIKMQACRERMFPIVSKPWSESAPTLLKSPRGNGGLQNGGAGHAKVPEKTEVAVVVIDALPTLVVEGHPFQEASLMLLDGEVCELSLIIRNTSTIPASIFDISTTNDAVQLHEIVIEEDSSDISQQSSTTLLKPDETATFTFDVMGRRNISTVDVKFAYSVDLTSSGQSQPKSQRYARIITIPVTLTVNAALQVQRLDALPLDIAQNGECSFVLAFDVGNAWPKSLFYSCFCTDLKLKSAEPRRCHNHEGVLAPGQVQRVFMPIARPEILIAEDAEPEAVRKNLLKRLRILWELEDEERKGWVDLSNLQMTEQTREVVVGAAISLSLEIIDIPSVDEPTITTNDDNDDDDVDTSNNEQDEAKQPRPTPAPRTARAGSFFTLRATMHNRAARSVPLIAHLIPHALDSSDPERMARRIGFSGAQMRFVPPIAQHMEEQVDFVLCPLAVGIVELEVVVKAAFEKDDGGGGGWGKEWTSHKKVSLRVV